MSQTMVIVDSTELTAVIYPLVSHEVMNHGLSTSDIESVFDWLISQAVSENLRVQVQQHVVVDRHYRNDVYRCIYDSIGQTVYSYVERLIQANDLTFIQNERVKLLVTYRNIILIRSFFDGML